MANFNTLSQNPFHWSLLISVNVISMLIVVQDKNLGGIVDFTLSLVLELHPTVNPVTVHPYPVNFSPSLSL